MVDIPCHEFEQAEIRERKLGGNSSLYIFIRNINATYLSLEIIIRPQVVEEYIVSIFGL
jgi:hypothetical protein